jgi:hypothetical protein
MKKIIILFTLQLLLVACQTKPGLGEKTGLPGDSLATISHVLHDDIMENLKYWVNKELSCPNFTVNDTVMIKRQGKILMDAAGRLHSGVSKEKWSLSHCGKQSDIILIIKSDGKGGNYVAIAKADE